MTTTTTVHASPVIHTHNNQPINIEFHKAAPPAPAPPAAPQLVAKLATARVTGVARAAAPHRPITHSLLQRSLLAARDEAATVAGKVKAMNSISGWDWHDKLVKRYVGRADAWR